MLVEDAVTNARARSFYARAIQESETGKVMVGHVTFQIAFGTAKTVFSHQIRISGF